MSQDVKYSKIICYRTEPSAIWQIFYESHILLVISWSLSHSFPMLSFPTHWKHWKTVNFSDVFRGQRKGALGTNGLRWKNGKIWEASKMLVNNARGYYAIISNAKVYKIFDASRGNNISKQFYDRIYFNFIFKALSMNHIRCL